MPAFNVEAYISEAIESVLKQSFPNWELIVVDDGSRDGTVQAIREFKDPRILLFRQGNAGAGAARNRGITESHSSIICFIDADDRLRPYALSRLISALEQNPQACVAYGENILMDVSGRVFGTEKGLIFAPRPSGQVLRYILQGNFVLTSGVAIRANCLTNVGSFRTDLPRAQDWELWCRLATTGEFIYIGREPIVEYRIRPGSISRTIGMTATETLRSIDAVFSNPEIRHCFAERELTHLRRKQEAQAYASAGRECLRTRSWAQARRFFFKSLWHDYRSLRRLGLLGLSLLQWLPSGVEHRLR